MLDKAFAVPLVLFESLPQAGSTASHRDVPNRAPCIPKFCVLRWSPWAAPGADQGGPRESSARDPQGATPSGGPRVPS
jgi:hypothetical protein